MELKSVFQSIIRLHQRELPFNLTQRELELPIDNKRILTVTGVRRCGKSSMLGLVINKLIERGVKREQILYIGFDDERFMSISHENLDEILQAYRELYPEHPLSSVYMFFDEIQLVTGWELFVLRVYKNYCKNIYITGSTAKMLSDEMASALRGWPDEYRAFPLNFKEYLTFKGIQEDVYSEQGAAIIANAFKKYCREGGFPQVVLTERETDKVKILQSYLDTMLLRDIIDHYHVKSNVTTVKYFLKRVMSNLTKPTSINNILNDIKSQGAKVSKDSLYTWLEYACNISLFTKVCKYSKSLLKQSISPAKYYVADMALRNAVILPQSDEYGKALENIVFQMLYSNLSKSDSIYYYNEGKECDFVIVRDTDVSELIQVCWELNEDNAKREIDGLLSASLFTGCKNCKIITFNQEKNIIKDGIRIDVVKIWKI